MLVCCGISPSGECLAFGGSGGYLHLWANSAQPSVCGLGQGQVWRCLHSELHPDPNF